MIGRLQGDTLASCDSMGVVKLWDVRKNAPMVSIKVGPHPANKVAFDPSGRSPLSLSVWAVNVTVSLNFKPVGCVVLGGVCTGQSPLSLCVRVFTVLLNLKPIFYFFKFYFQKYFFIHFIIHFGKFGPPYLGKTTADARAVLPSPTHACWVLCFRNPLNSDMDYRIFNMHM